MAEGKLEGWWWVWRSNWEKEHIGPIKHRKVLVFYSKSKGNSLKINSKSGSNV